MTFIDRAYALFLKVLSVLQCAFLLGVRLCWGWQFLQSGIGKITHIDKTVSFFTDLGIPAPSLNAHLNAGLETIGGILLMLGLGSRVIAFPLTISMIVAFLTAEHDKFKAFFSDSATFFAADAFPFLLASLLILLFGPGFFSMDTLIANHRKSGLAAMGRARLFLLLWVLFILVYVTIYAGFDGDPIALVKRWRNALIAVAFAALAYGVTQAILKKGNSGQAGLQSKQA